VHSDLRPGNVLVHETTPGARDLQLSDFGGSVCEELGLDGLSLPDGSFYSPVFENKSGPLLDIFATGSMFYTILTGRWPYKETSGTFTNFDERFEWEEQVVFPKFKAEQFPDVQHLPGGAVILKCWMRQFKTARDMLVEREGALPAGLDNDDNLKN
jgi:serine/threonine protein kinase